MIVVTGGAGFIGSNLVAALEARGIVDVAVVDRFGSDDKWRNLAKRELAALVPPEEVMAFLDAHAAEVDVVFHLGAISATTERDVDLIVRNNVVLSMELWRWCAWRGARLIYASSAATYGGGEHGFVDDEQPDALAMLRPLNAYGWSKHLFDRRVARAVVRGEPAPPQWAGLKFFNVYGPNERHKGDMMSVVAKLHPQLATGKGARLFKSHRPDYDHGGQLRDFIWVGDCVDVMLWLLDNPGVSGLFNVGTGRARSFRDLAEATFAALGRAPDIEYFDMPEELQGKYQYFTQADTGKLRAAGFDLPFTELEEGVRRYVQDFLSTDDPYA
ncbi:ADP-glyceromanno-heptose 6-epimerase [Azospirillum sp. RWY-5-1]|uniref:ADP-L-glycero-D-manno-heptose-6-epimerase n=1 Tax=Azospirillum oleiclasticum TaxID=2735135 RepID=A0ABX2TBF2_9PROT|nr:ADP-glyceromanno-heptose 6-epimerase [Azospirillum oleiclasticum]NYZ14131.1 ADP-glyceromanno-heptose 6-epimerase [Azospirillum oleiclasticum]NYZ21615.1 ADP-glyceromanno-heptose 6-epimerase [Azospirillum oleiclasticum]